MKNYKPYIISISVILGMLILFYYLGEIILPFFIGLIGAYLMNPIIKKIMNWGMGRNLAVTTFLVISIASVVGISVIFGTELIRDISRLNKGVQTFVSDHSTEIDEGNQKIKSYIESFYSLEELEEEMAQQRETADTSSTGDMEQIKSALGSLTSFFGAEENVEGDEEPRRSLNWILIFFSAIGYFLYIIYTYPYFEKKIDKYFDQKVKNSGGVQRFIQDFRRIFMHYFRQRSKIVLINFLFFLATFLIIDLPGAILIALLAALLTYIAHFHYLALIPASLGCWILSIETGHSFWIFFGVIGGVFILMSILEEAWLNDKIMKDFNGLNPAMMIVSFAVWTHIFGATIGTLIALPLTTVMLIYLDRLLLYLKDNLTESPNNQE